MKSSDLLASLSPAQLAAVRGQLAHPAPRYPVPPAPAPERTRRVAGQMNRTEAAYASHLESLRLAGVVVWYAFECITLKLAERTRYTPDFAIIFSGGAFEFREVKGFWRDDARVKVKVAAEKFPWRFVAVQKTKDGWAEERFPGAVDRLALTEDRK